MDHGHLSISAFDDPAPDNDHAPSNNDLPSARSAGSTRALKRRLHYRAEIEVTGRRYKGRRVTRSDANLDSRSLGLLDADEDDPALSQEVSALNKQLQEAHDEDKDGDGDDDDLTEDADHSTSSIDDEDAAIEKAQVSSRRKELDEERAITKRLAAVEKSDVQRAAAVRKQRDVYDAVVNLRIRFEPLMKLARSFPNEDQRKSCDAWQEGNEKQAELKAATEAALSSLISHLEAVFMSSWPSSAGRPYNEIESDDDDDVQDAVDMNKANSDFELWRDAVLNLWGRKVSDASGVIPKDGFKAFDTSVTAQMKAAISSGKHLARTRRVAEPLTLVGGVDLERGSHTMQFDDGEFYRTLLREIIESGDAPGGGLRHAQLSKEGRVKKKKDVSYSKGKRINYKVHEQMVGFLAPVPLPDPGPVDQILANLFGERRKVPIDVES